MADAISALLVRQWALAACYDAHDEVTFGMPGMPQFGPQFRNAWPLLQGDKLYVAPFDSKRFYCLDKNSGKSMWTINDPAGPFEGIAPGGELLFSVSNSVSQGYPPPLGQRGIGCQFYRADTGQFAWEFFPTYLCTWHFNSHYPGRYNETYCLDRPVLTEDGRMLMATEHSPGWGYQVPDMMNCAYGEWCLSTTQRKLLDYRICYNDFFASTVAGVVGGFVKNSKDSWRLAGDRPPVNVNSPPDYDPVKRMPFKYHGVVCELADYRRPPGNDLRRRSRCTPPSPTAEPHGIFTRRASLSLRTEKTTRRFRCLKSAWRQLSRKNQSRVAKSSGNFFAFPARWPGRHCWPATRKPPRNILSAWPRPPTLPRKKRSR